LKEARLTEITRYFSLKGPAWMPAYAGMTNYDIVSPSRGMRIVTFPDGHYLKAETRDSNVHPLTGAFN